MTLGLFHLKSYYGVSALNFLDQYAMIFHISGEYPAVIFENNSDHPVAISAKQVGPPLAYNFILSFLGYPAVACLTFTTTNPMKWGGWKKIDHPAMFRWFNIDTTPQTFCGPPCSNIHVATFLRPPCGDFLKGAPRQ